MIISKHIKGLVLIHSSYNLTLTVKKTFIKGIGNCKLRKVLKLVESWEHLGQDMVVLYCP